MGAFNVDEEAYTTHELSDLTEAVHLSPVKGTPIATGDFDSDQYTDIIVLSAARDELSVLLWDHEEHVFSQGPMVGGLAGVVNVVATDLNRDGHLDILVMSEEGASLGAVALGNQSAAPREACTRLTFIPGHIDHFGDPVRLPPAFGQPIAVNVDSEPATDLFGESCADGDLMQGRGDRSFWINDGEGNFDRRKANMGSKPLAHVPSVSAVDIDGDCRVDLVVPVTDFAKHGGTGGVVPGAVVTLEVWLAPPSGHAAHLFNSQMAAPSSPHSTVTLPQGVQQLTWADLNGDGAQDALGPVCDPWHGCAPNVTTAPQLFRLSTQRGIDAKHLCVPDPWFQLSAQNMTIAGLPRRYTGFASARAHSPLDLPPLVRIGDFDLDGFPDVVVGLADDEGSPRTVLLRNRRGDALETTYWRATPSGSIIIVDVPSDIPAGLSPDMGAAAGGGSHAAAFFDVGETGNLDLLLVAGSADKPKIELLRNTFSSDDYFLKVLTLDGQCLRWCGGKGEEPSPPPYGVNQPGVSYMFVSTAAAGAKRRYAGTQLGTSAHSPLATPFVLFGLGRTNDYVNDLWVGLPGGARRRFDAGIIPNSQLIAIPNPTDRPSRWKIELYISKASMLPWVALALSAGLMCIGMVVVLLEVRERREDAREKKAMAPSLPL